TLLDVLDLQPEKDLIAERFVRDFWDNINIGIIYHIVKSDADLERFRMICFSTCSLLKRISS
ncbi:hypothetical protein PENTCL1PPCAC_20504, partial [Pristionchus entomophagus]